MKGSQRGPQKAFEEMLEESEEEGRKEPRKEERGGKETVEEGEMISDEDDEKYEPGAR